MSAWEVQPALSSAPLRLSAVTPAVTLKSLKHPASADITLSIMSATNPVPLPSAQHENVTPPSHFRCPICLEDCSLRQSARALRCSHPTCSACLRRAWTYSITARSEPFPRCPIPGCAAYASDASAAALLSAATTKQMRKLRHLKPTRAADGRRMFCVADGCFEQLPPPPPPPLGRGAAEGGSGDSAVATCPECGQGTCLRCGCPEHKGAVCVKPLACGRQRRMYDAYAVGRIGACPRCGVHVERDGGCRAMRCTRCRHRFQFRPFRTPEEARDAGAGEEMRPRPVSAAAAGSAENGAILGAMLFLMVWGSGFGGVPLVMFVSRLGEGDVDWEVLMFVPFIAFGVPAFVVGWLGFLSSCVTALRRARQQEMRSAAGRAFCGGFVLGVTSCLDRLVGTCMGRMPTWVWFFYFLPVYCCGAALLMLAVVDMRAARRTQRAPAV